MTNLISQLRAVACGLGVLLASSPLWSATLPEGFRQVVLASGLRSPTALVELPDGRILVAEQDGRVLAVSPSGGVSTLFTLNGINAAGERGLLGLALHPNFAQNRYLYVYYTAASPTLHNRLSRFPLPSGGGVGAEQPLHDFPPIGNAIWHMGGGLRFAADGTLFVAVGDHQKPNEAKRLASPFGKVHRFRDDGSTPADNPFLDPFLGAYPSVWAFGLRNPYTLDVQAETGRVFLNDVGQNSWEEINEGFAGDDYGWPTNEGSQVGTGQTAPLYAYAHSNGACAITGGAFYPRSGGSFPPEFSGEYLFVDYCVGFLRSFDPETLQVKSFATGLEFPTNLAVDAQGSLLYLARGTGDTTTQPLGKLVRIERSADSSLLPAITAPPVDVEVGVGETATFRVAVDNATALQWQRELQDLPGEDQPELVIPGVTQGDDGGRFRVVAKNVHGSVASAEVTLHVSPNLAPLPVIVAPAGPTFVAPGAQVDFSGSATDPEDGTLEADALSWDALLHHNEHSHPLVPPTPGASGSFEMPEGGHGPGLVWIELRLTATDSAGRSATVSRAVYHQELADPGRADVLTLGGGRWLVALTYVDPLVGTQAAATALALTADSGGFWFFAPSNLELLVKMVDGGPVNGQAWVFFGALSDIEYTLIVLDVATGSARSYSRPAGAPSCGLDTSVFPASASSAAFLSQAAATDSKQVLEDGELSLLGGRFALSVDWSQPSSGASGSGHAISFTDESGFFWFFSPENLEVAVKMLDGGAVNGQFWLFFTGLSDLQMTLTVRDTFSGVSRTFEQPQQACSAWADTSAFPSP